MNIPDNIFDESLNRLRKGESPSQIANTYEEVYQQELIGLLSVAQMGMNIPKIVPPTPYKTQRFLQTKASTYSKLFEMLSFFRIAAVPISLVIAIVGGGAVASATNNSLPGQYLYSLKRASEEVRLTLTKDQTQVASLHVELMQKRLDEVKKAADTGNAATETLAIAELKSQTEKTFAEAGPLATANAISKDSSLLDNLVALNKEQKTVLTELSVNSDTNSGKEIATSALADSKKNDQTLAKIIATVNDQVLADMPNKVTVTGAVSSAIGDKVTVEKNTFTVNDHTTISNPDGTPTTDIKSVVGRANIIGTKLADGSLVAKQILILAPDGTVKGDSTTVGTTPTIIKPKPVVTDPKDPATTTDATEPIPLDPTKAQGSFITEPSESQYTP